MKLKNKIYIVQLFIALSFIFFFYTFYNGYIEEKERDLNYNIETISQTNKQFIEQSLKSIYKDYQYNQKKFYTIHQFAQNEYLKNSNKNLKILKDKIKKQFDISGMAIDLFLINKNYIITHSTFTKDIGFNLGNIEDAKNYLDRTKVDGKIHVASNLSFDIMDSNTNVYSYSKLSEDLYFEMGFKIQNTFFEELKENLNKIYQNTKNKISIYRITETTNKKEFYINILEKKSTNLSKQDFESKIKKFEKGKKTNDKYINAIRFNKTQKEIVNDAYAVYIPLLTKDKNEHLFYNNILMKIEIDISEYQQTLKQTKQSFSLFAFVVFIFLVMLYYFIKYNFNKPMAKITNTFASEKKIEDYELLNKKDEFGVLVDKYNKLYDSLNKEIKLNENLLLENKRFIADTVHQIRTPLTNIMMNGEMVKKFQKDDKLSLFVDQIDASINMLSNSYEDLAYVTTYDSIEYKPNKISLSDMLNKRIKFFTTISKVNFKEIESNITNDIYIHINAIELERIIDNNISNAIKYAQVNKSIFISLTKVNDEILLEFKTFGEPIKNKEKIFEKNYRENESKRGLGLGLNMVKNICKKNNIEYKVHGENEQNIFTYTFR